MDLTIIIVNYNVRYFLEQCLHSVFEAADESEIEIIVVDNDSSDDSLEMLERQFPYVQVIANEENVGFSKANNQAIRIAKGQYVLLLNPDTLISEDTLKKCIEFVSATPNAGIIGVKMIDGSGKYLPESKRGIPTPIRSFFKLSGLYSLLPKSKWLNGYYLGHLNPDENQEIEVVPGAFMFMNTQKLLDVGLLDEQFFMYGEDIDLSYRFLQKGHQNYYLADTRIIHYKGESTKKSSLNYVRVFYSAMLIFAQKHFSGGPNFFYTLAIKCAVVLKATMSLLRRFLERFFIPICDAVVIAGGLILLKDFWANYYHHNPAYYPKVFEYFNVPLYTSIWIGSIFLSGGYDSYQNIRQLVRGIFMGTLILAAVYGFLDLSFRPSRALIIFGAIWTLLITVGIRYLYHFVRAGNLKVGRKTVKNLVVVSSEPEAERIHNIILKAGVDHNYVGFVVPESRTTEQALGTLSSLDDIAGIYDLDEVVFNASEVKAERIMSAMTALGSRVHFKMVTSGGGGIIGSKSKNEPGELYTMDLRFNLNEIYHRRNKWLFDRTMAMAYVLLFPLSLFFSKNPINALYKAMQVLFGKRTWIGYHQKAGIENLPVIKQGICTPLSGKQIKDPGLTMVKQVNVLYAKDYTVARDMDILLKNWFKF